MDPFSVGDEDDDEADHYATLGLTQAAKKEDVQAAFRTLARAHHPDKGGDAAVFQEVRRAHDVLSNDALRSEYDERYARRDDAAHASATVTVPIGALYRDSRHTVRFERSDDGRRSAAVRDVVVPAGTHHCARLVVDGGGGENDGGSGQPLVVVVRHQSLRGVTVSGRDVIQDALVTLEQALCGGGFVVRRPDGVRLRAMQPAGDVVGPGGFWRLPGHGLPHCGGAGDLIVRTRVVFPATVAPDVQPALRGLLPGGGGQETAAGLTVVSAVRASRADAGAPGRAERTVLSQAASAAGCPVQ